MLILNARQRAQLLAPLNGNRVSSRSVSGSSLSYLEAWDVKAHLTRIFGFGGWDGKVISADIAYAMEVPNSRGNGTNWSVGYKVIYELTVYGQDHSVAVYSEAAVGFASLPQLGEAHDMAIKTAESDALKRCAINLGTQFGLSLYNRGSLTDVIHVTLDQDTDSVPDQSDTGTSNVEAQAYFDRIAAAVRTQDAEDLVTVRDLIIDADLGAVSIRESTLAEWVERAFTALRASGVTLPPTAGE